MNLLLINDVDRVSSDTVVITDVRIIHHCRTVLKISTGSSLKIGIINGDQGTGRVISISDQCIELQVTFTQTPPRSLPVLLCIALPRPKVFLRVIYSATCFGVKHIIFFRTWRVEPGYWNSPLLKPEIIKKTCITALEQSVDTILPTIEFRHTFKPFVEDEIPLFRSTVTNAWVAHPKATTLFPHAIVPSSSLLCLGPEGGFIEYEIDLLKNHGITPASMGERILRVEQMIPALLGRLY